MEPCLSIVTDVGDVVLRQSLMVLSVYGVGSAAADPSRCGTNIWLREPDTSFAVAGAVHPCAAHRRPVARLAMATAAARRMAAASKRHTHVAASGSAGQLGRSETALFARRYALGCGARALQTGSAYRIRTMLCSSLRQRSIFVRFISAMDKCGSSQQFGRVCLRSPA